MNDMNEPYYDNGNVQLYQADARALPLADESVDCIVTSPPYWSLRDYGVEGQLGLESTPGEYVAHMVEVFREVWRVLKPTGVVFLNLGDSYYSNPGNGRGGGSTLGGGKPHLDGAQRVAGNGNGGSLKPKDLVGIPWRVAFALQDDGWWLRSDIIWSKPNPMPESVTDRPSSAHEHVFLLAQRERYYYDAEAIREPAVGLTRHDLTGPGLIAPGQTPQGGNRHRATDKERGHGRRHAGFNDLWDGMTKSEQGAMGRNKRDVWTIATQPYAEAHFATFPEALVEPCILAGTSERGVCPECGAPWARVVERVDTGATQKSADGWDTGAGAHSTIHRDGREQGKAGQPVMASVTVGWAPTCEHDAAPVPAIVLDPFVGSGTVAAVAQRLGRRAVGVDLSAEYLAMAAKRVGKVSMPMAL